MVKEARSTCTLEEHSLLEINNRQLRKELETLKLKLNSEENARREAEQRATMVTNEENGMKFDILVAILSLAKE